MKAIYTRHIIKSDDPFGEDYLRFEIYFKTETLPELKLPVSPSLDDIISHTKSYDENIFTYLSGIREKSEASIHYELSSMSYKELKEITKKILSVKET